MNTLQKQFSDALKREGKFITTYYTSESVNCLFRINNDNNNTDNHITIFYDIDSPIKQGQLLTYGGKVFITMNKESIENDTYYKSALRKCNTQIIVGDDNGIGHLVPCYTSDLKQPAPNTGKIITTVDGNIDLITEDYKQIIKFLDIDDQHIIMNGTWKIINKIVKSGICYFYMQRILNSPVTYTFDVTSEFATYDEGTQAQLTVLPKADGITDPTATITYSSSDESIATVDSNGLVNCIIGGDVIITVIWTDQNLTDTLLLTVKSNAPLIYHADITGDYEADSVKVGLTYTCVATFKDSNNVVVTATNPVWSTGNYSLSGMESVLTLTDNHNGTCTILVDANAYDYLAESFNLICTDETLSATGFVTLMIVGMF